MTSPARLAQSVEHQTFNLRVMGSSPISGGTSTCFFLAQSSLLAQGKIAPGFRRAKTTKGRTDDVEVPSSRGKFKNKLTRQNSTEEVSQAMRFDWLSLWLSSFVGQMHR